MGILFNQTQHKILYVMALDKKFTTHIKKILFWLEIQNYLCIMLTYNPYNFFIRSTISPSIKIFHRNAGMDTKILIWTKNPRAVSTSKKVIVINEEGEIVMKWTEGRVGPPLPNRYPEVGRGPLARVKDAGESFKTLNHDNNWN